jgi:molecular chaperone HscB
VANPSTSEAACWSCHGPLGKLRSFCDTCGAVQPPAAGDLFARLDLAPGFDLEPKELDRLYFARQRQLHPDRFRAKTAREQAFAQGQAADLNEAYETLRDPLSRAVFLLKRAGRRIDDSDGVTVHDKALLMEAMEAREALSEAEDAGAVEALMAQAQADADAVTKELSELFRSQDLDRAVRATLRLKYLRKLAEEARLRRRRFSAAA